jgi:predicted ATPase
VSIGRESQSDLLVRVLGTIDIVDGDGTVHRLPSVSQRRFIAHLAVDAGRIVRTEHLTDSLGVSRGALRTTVSRLRGLIRGELIRTEPTGFRLVADVDSRLFADAVAAQPLEAQRAGADLLDRLDGALALWRGDAFAEFADEPWAEPEAVRLSELRAVAIDRRAGELIARGRCGEAVAALESLVAAQPLRDHTWGLLMEALAADGRQVEALRSYQRYRAYLAEAMGAEPSLTVQRLERRIALGGVETGPGGASEPSGRERTDADRAPRFRSALFGRDDELRELTATLGVGRVVTLVGEGGVGKTRLAVEATFVLPEDLSVWFVDLTAVADVHVVPVAAAVATGVPGTEDPAALAEFLRERRGVLVLDNCEHVRSGAAVVAETLAARCPDITVLATSRESLGVPGEVVVRVAPLAPDGAGSELFRDRAERAGATVWPRQHEIVTTICRRLDGNPLAIEIAAVRVAALGLDTVRAGLDDRFTVLADGRAGAGDRHRSLRATVEWSYRLLPPNDQRMFRRLGAFTGGFELDAIEYVTEALGGAATHVVGSLATLVDRSMVVAETDAEVTRFRLLDTLRAFAQAEAHEHGESEAIADAHAGWVAELTDLDHAEWMSGDCHRRALRLEREVANWRSAFDHARRRGDVDLAHRLCGAPSALLVWGRPDLDPVMQSHAGLLVADDPRRASVALASWGPAWAALDFTAMQAVEDRLSAVESDDRSGALAVIASARELVMGDVAAAIARRQDAIDDPARSVDARDYCAVLALYLTCSGGATHLRRPEWIDGVTAVVERSEVPVNRLIGRVGLAWALADRDLEASDAWLRAVLTPDEPMPAFHRTLAGAFASRLLITRAPELAAARLHEVLSVEDRVPGMTDTVALVTAAGLLASARHAVTDDLVTTLAQRSATAYLGSLVPDVAERRTRGRVLSYDRLVVIVRDALLDLTAGSAGTSPALREPSIEAP